MISDRSISPRALLVSETYKVNIYTAISQTEDWVDIEILRFEGIEQDNMGEYFVFYDPEANQHIQYESIELFTKEDIFMYEFRYIL